VVNSFGNGGENNEAKVGVRGKEDVIDPVKRGVNVGAREEERKNGRSRQRWERGGKR